MSWHLIHYLLKSYFRSYRFFPPLIFYLLSILLLYTYKPNPIMDSYAVSSIVVYLLSCWLCYSFISSAEATQGHIVMTHTGSSQAYFNGKTAAIFVCCFVLCLFALVYPIAADIFDEPVGIGQFLLALTVHVELALLGMLVALFFGPSIMSSGRFSIAMILFILIVTIAKSEIAEDLWGGFHYILWLLPPVSDSFQILMQLEAYSTMRLAVALIYPLLYFIVLYLVYLYLRKKRM